jgi:hypothetical protein
MFSLSSRRLTTLHRKIRGGWETRLGSSEPSHLRMMRKIPCSSPQVCTFYITWIKLCCVVLSHLEKYRFLWDIKCLSKPLGDGGFITRSRCLLNNFINSAVPISDLCQVFHTFCTQTKCNVNTACASFLISETDSQSISKPKCTLIPISAVRLCSLKRLNVCFQACLPPLTNRKYTPYRVPLPDFTFFTSLNASRHFSTYHNRSTWQFLALNCLRILTPTPSTAPTCY